MTASTLIESVADTTSLRDRDDINHAVARLLLMFLDAELVSIYQLMDDNGTKRVARSVALARGGAEAKAEVESELSALPALEEVAVWQECVLRRDVVQHLSPNGFCCNVFPVESERDVVGILEIQLAGELQPRDAGLVSGILRIFKNHLALLDYGERDTLTGLLNRKTFEASFDKLRQRLSNVAPGGEPSWLGMVDIDKFKLINDSHGHLFGDEVLLLVGQIMKRNFRGADQLFRFGGEEFVIVLDHASKDGAQIAFERLRARVEEHQFPQVGRVTISLGYTCIQPQDGPSACVERADAALYYGKQHGRNRVCDYEMLVATGELVVTQKHEDIELF